VVNPFVAAPGFNTNVVNGGTLELFPVAIMLNKQFIPAAFTSRRAFFPAGSKSVKPLKMHNFHWPVTSH